jgi:branched-chain amino acid transport system permease protein
MGATHLAASAPRWVIWAAFALLLAAAPLLFSSHLSVSLLTQMGIAIIACLSYNILLGQGGMLSFGHAVYTGLGAYMAIHALNAISAGALVLPVSLVPLVGGLAGLGFAMLLGFVTTRKAGTPFAMITLGMAELVFAVSLMFSGFFGGEAGVPGNRVVGTAVWGISFGPPLQVYYLVAFYTGVCVALMYAFTRTPLGRILNAVRDNPERAGFIGFDTRFVRYLAFMIAGFFAGIAGGLAAINFEIVTPEVLGAARSGGYLLFTFLGGSTVFFGPIIGGVLMVLAFVLFSELTQAWLLYLGLIFLFAVIYLPGGLASLVLAHARLVSHGRWMALLPLHLALLAAALVALAGCGAAVEMLYHLQLNAAMGDTVQYLGMALPATLPSTWLAAVLLALVGAGLLEGLRRRYRQRWNAIQADIERERLQQEGA